MNANNNIESYKMEDEHPDEETALLGTLHGESKLDSDNDRLWFYRKRYGGFRPLFAFCAMIGIAILVTNKGSTSNQPAAALSVIGISDGYASETETNAAKFESKPLDWENIGSEISSYWSDKNLEWLDIESEMDDMNETATDIAIAHGMFHADAKWEFDEWMTTYVNDFLMEESAEEKSAEKEAKKIATAEWSEEKLAKENWEEDKKILKEIEKYEKKTMELAKKQAEVEAETKEKEAELLAKMEEKEAKLHKKAAKNDVELMTKLHKLIQEETSAPTDSTDDDDADKEPEDVSFNDLNSISPSIDEIEPMHFPIDDVVDIPPTHRLDMMKDLSEDDPCTTIVDEASANDSV